MANFGQIVSAAITLVPCVVPLIPCVVPLVPCVPQPRPAPGPPQKFEDTNMELFTRIYPASDGSHKKFDVFLKPAAGVPPPPRILVRRILGVVPRVLGSCPQGTRGFPQGTRGWSAGY